MSQWDFPSMQMAQPPHSDLVASLGGIGQLYQALQQAHLQSQQQRYLQANPYQGANNVGALQALAQTAGLGHTQAETAGLTGAEGRAAGANQFFQDQYGAPQAGVEAEQRGEGVNQGWAQLAELGRSHQAEEGFQGQDINLKRQGLSLQAGQNAAQNAMETQKIADEGTRIAGENTYHNAMAEALTDRGQGSKLHALSTIGMFPGAVDPATGQLSDMGRHLLGQFGVDMPEPAAKPSPITDAVSAYLHSKGAAGQPAPQTGGAIGSALTQRPPQTRGDSIWNGIADYSGATGFNHALMGLAQLNRDATGAAYNWWNHPVNGAQQ